MTTEPRDPRVRRLVFELMEAAPAPRPFADRVAVVTEEPPRGGARRTRVLAAAIAVVITVAAVAVVVASRHSSAKHPPIEGPSTTLPKHALVGAGAAPDVAFVDRRGLVVRASGSGADVVVAPGAVSSPRWSPSGDWLAYRVGNALWVVGRDGSQRRKLSDDAGPNYFSDTYSWSPTVDALAVVDAGGARVWWFSGSGAHSEDVAPPPVSGTTSEPQGVAWSQGGSSLALSIEHRTGGGAPSQPVESLWLATGVCSPVPTTPTSCGPPRQMQKIAFTPGPQDYPIFPAGVAFGNRDLLVWPDTGGSGSILQDGLPLEAVPLDGGPTVTMMTTLTRASWVVPSPDEQRLLVVRSNGRMVTDNRELDVCDAPASCHAVAPGNDVQTMDPAWSHDGTRIVFVREADASSTPPFAASAGPDWTVKYRTRTLWIANADGSGAQEITAAGGGIADPQLSPDGTTVVFVRDAQLWQIDLASGRVAALSGSMRLQAACTEQDESCLPDQEVYEMTSLWSDHEAVHFASTGQ